MRIKLDHFAKSVKRLCKNISLTHVKRESEREEGKRRHSMTVCVGWGEILMIWRKQDVCIEYRSKKC